MPRNLFDIPELVCSIAIHLDNQALFNCVQVSRAWAEHFVPLLWHTFSFKDRSPYKPKTTRHHRWKCFTNLSSYYDKLRLSASLAIAKNGHYIREIVVENPGALQLLAIHCSNLTKLVCHFSYCDDRYFSKHTHEVLAQIWELVRKSPLLHTLRLGGADINRVQQIPWPHGANEADVRAHLLYLQNLPMLRHLSVSMLDDDYFEFCKRFPRLEEARFRLQSIQSVIHPYHPQETRGVDSKDVSDDDDEGARQEGAKMVQCSLKQLVLEIIFGGCDAQVLQSVFRRFPRLERLKTLTHTPLESILLDLSTDPDAGAHEDDDCFPGLTDARGGPLLAFDVPTWFDRKVAGIVSSLPVPLKRIHWEEMGERTVEALATHSHKTLEVVTGGLLPRNSFYYDMPPERMPKTIGILLARCPKLRIVNSPNMKLHIRYLMEHPWVCCDNLERLNCDIVGIPEMSTKEKFLVEVVRQRRERQRQKHEDDKPLTEGEQHALEKRDLIARCMEAVQNQVAKCPKLKHSLYR
ncbi:hypothetical protein DFQ26_007594 [Actinomortierella ambigua]|nr:hypothetical protein DFQ26_007594 [Actinomortierella ambigua]